MPRASLAICLVAMLYIGLSVGGVPDSRSWNEWRTAFDRSYTTADEEKAGRETWLMNQRLVEEHNRQFDAGRRSYKMSLNAFADQDLAVTVRRPVKVSANQHTPVKTGASSSSSMTGPSSWDWRTKGVVNPIRNQGQINSAEAIDAADAVASFSAIHDSTYLYDLSLQEVVDCCLPEPIYNSSIFDCIQSHGGLCLAGSYHTGTGQNYCNNGSCKAVASPQHGSKQVKSGDEAALADAVIFTPVMVAVDASQMSFQLYSSGVYSDPACSSTQLDHVLLVVGYGADSSGLEYWICRNTWGASWGLDGYINIARNKNNMCGIATLPVYPY